jgi:tetratricopeptide (TPR) repeat protein
MLARLPLALTLFLAAAAAHAQPAPVPAPAGDVTAKAKELFLKGDTAYRLGNFAEALNLYMESLKLARRPSLLFNVAQCYRQLNQHERALFYYKLFLSDWDREKPGEPPPNADEVKGHIAALQQAMKDEEARKRDEAEKRRLEEERRREDALRLERLRIEQQGRAAATVGPKLARLHVTGLTVAGAAIIVDNVLKATSPLMGAIEIPPGRHRVRVEARGHYAWTGEIDPLPGGDARIDVSLRPHPTKSALWLTATIVTFAAAAGMEAMAVVYTLKANGHYQGTPAFSDPKNLAIAGHAAAGGLAAVGVTSLILYLRSGKVEEPPIRAAFAPLPGGGQAVATFRF